MQLQIKGILLMGLLTALPCWGDVIILKDGALINGLISRYENGNLYVESATGEEVFPLNQIEWFEVDNASLATDQAEADEWIGKASGESPSLPEDQMEVMLTNQQRMAERLDSLLNLVESIQKTISGVQTNQEIQTRRLTERTIEANPFVKLVVVNYQVVPQGGDTVVVGQVMNQSESPFSNVRVEVMAMGNSGKLGSEGGKKIKVDQVHPSTLAPGQFGQFTVRFDGNLMINDLRINVHGNPPSSMYKRQRQNPPVRRQGEIK